MVSAQMPLSPPVRTPVIRTPVEVRWPVIGPAVVDRPVVRGSVVRAPVGRVAIAVISRVTIAVVGGAGRCREPQDASGNRAGRDGATVIRSPPAPTITTVALVGFRGVGPGSCDQGGGERTEQGFAATACVVHELEEPERERQLVLRETPVRAEPGAQERPEPLDGVDVHLAKAIPVLIAGIFAAPVADRFVLIAPGGQAGVDAILVGMDEGALGYRGRDDRLDRRLLHVGHHVQDHRTPALDQAEDGWLVLLQRAAARRAGQPASTPKSPLLATAAGWPLWPATT